jgi:hypothetical protein
MSESSMFAAKKAATEPREPFVYQEPLRSSNLEIQPLKAKVELNGGVSQILTQINHIRY